jgi:AcrR family transcriptional regulator
MNEPINTHHLPADERKAVIIATMLELAASHNPGQITTAAIAKQMNLSQGALFRHFPTKDAVWQAVMEWITEELWARIEQQAQAAATALAALDSIFTTHLDFVMSYPGVPRIIFHELQRAEDTAAKERVRLFIKQYRECLSALFEQGKIQGEFPPLLPVFAASTLFLGMIQGLVMQSLISGIPLHNDTMTQAVFSLYLNSIRRSQ